MEFSFPWPWSQGEWLAWGSAAVTLVLGVMLMFAPRLSLRLLGFQALQAHPEMVAEVRATMSGFQIGVGLSCILLAQPFLYLALGFSWAFVAFGRILSILSGGGGAGQNWAALLLHLVLAALPLVYVFGVVP